MNFGPRVNEMDVCILADASPSTPRKELGFFLGNQGRAFCTYSTVDAAHRAKMNNTLTKVVLFKLYFHVCSPAVHIVGANIAECNTQNKATILEGHHADRQRWITKRYTSSHRLSDD